jgi:hypothetical protein
MPRYPEILKPTAYEPIVVSPVHVINVPKATPVFLSWRGNKILDDYNGKLVLNVGGEPAFAELAILWAMRAVGWEGVWIDTYGRKYRTGYWGVPPLSDIPPERAKALERIYARAGSRSGAWDVYCWNGTKVLFAESGVTPIKPDTQLMPLRTSYTPLGTSSSSLCAERSRCNPRTSPAIAPEPRWRCPGGSHEHNPA